MCDFNQEERDNIDIELTHVRASESIRIVYESERDGWVISTPVEIRTADGRDFTEEWWEVAFIPSFPLGATDYKHWPDKTEGPFCLMPEREESC